MNVKAPEAPGDVPVELRRYWASDRDAKIARYLSSGPERTTRCLSRLENWRPRARPGGATPSRRRSRILAGSCSHAAGTGPAWHEPITGVD